MSETPKAAVALICLALGAALAAPLIMGTGNTGVINEPPHKSEVAANSEPAPVNEPVHITGRAIWGNYEKKLTYIEGDIRIVQGKTLITTEKAELNLDKKTALFSNQVNLVDLELAIKAERLDYDLKRKSGTFKQHVFLNRIEAKDGGGKTKREPFTLSADELYFESNTQNFVARGQGQIKHPDFSGQAETVEYKDQEQKLIFRGRAEIVQGSTTIRTEGAELDLSHKRLVLLEKAESIQPDVKIDAGDLDYDYDRKIGTFKKQVVLNRLKVNDPKQKTQKDPFRLTTDELAFETETNNFVARGNGILEHQDFTGAADRIEYDDASQILFFEGSASLKRPKGETIKGDLIRINLRDQTFTVRNNAVAELKVDSEK